jgi:hypothetical protein
MFNKNRSSSSGRSTYCKACTAVRKRGYRLKDYEVTLASERTSRGKRHWSVNLLKSSKSGAIQRNLEHAITLEDILQLYESQDGLCYWLGVQLGDETLPNRHPLKPSLDRLDSSKGYIVGNVVLSCTFANLGKSDNSPETTKDFIELLKLTIK